MAMQVLQTSMSHCLIWMICRLSFWEKHWNTCSWYLHPTTTFRWMTLCLPRKHILFFDVIGTATKRMVHQRVTICKPCWILHCQFNWWLFPMLYCGWCGCWCVVVVIALGHCHHGVCCGTLSQEGIVGVLFDTKSIKYCDIKPLVLVFFNRNTHKTQNQPRKYAKYSYQSNEIKSYKTFVPHTTWILVPAFFGTLIH